jgi:hypothetical protein
VFFFTHSPTMLLVTLTLILRTRPATTSIGENKRDEPCALNRSSNSDLEIGHQSLEWVIGRICNCLQFNASRSFRCSGRSPPENCPLVKKTSLFDRWLR